MRTTFEDSICYKQNRMSVWIMITIMLIDIVFFVIAFSTKETDENNEKKIYNTWNNIDIYCNYHNNCVCGCIYIMFIKFTK